MYEKSERQRNFAHSFAFLCAVYIIPLLESNICSKVNLQILTKGDRLMGSLKAILMTVIAVLVGLLVWNKFLAGKI